MERTPGRVLVIVPTYNERENLPLITRRLREALPDVHLLVADDNSPDGTGRIADELAEADDHVHVMHRTSKQGLGAAYIAGFRWGLDEGYDVLVEMDADGSHQPEELHKLLDAVADGADLAIGSRWVPGGKTVNWPVSREILSRGPTPTSGWCSASRCATPRRASAPTARPPWRRSGWTTSSRRATASRWTSRSAPYGRACG